VQDEITHDTLLRGRVKLLQPKRGFRSSLDPVLLAGFLAPPFGRFLDIGCATGALSFLLLARDPTANGVGVDIQPRLAELAGRGCADNGFADRLQVLTADVRTKGVLAPGTFDLVATNPPFRPIGTGVLPPLSEKALANHEVSLALAEWLDVAASVLVAGGRLATVFPFDRADELQAALSARGFSVTRRRAVVPRINEPASRILVEARASSRLDVPSVAEPPLVVHDEAGYSPEVRQMLGDPP
jgi:tRNA1Val (adenine37-N6)-methyltransferase